jgi:hypothetical protein
MVKDAKLPTRTDWAREQAVQLEGEVSDPDHAASEAFVPRK